MSSSPLVRHLRPHRTHRRPRATRALAVLAVAVVGGGVLSACGSGGGPDASGDGADRPSVVASTTVYADIARRVAGDHATVEAVISDPVADPHSYEASPADAAAVATADVVVYNGAGYDSFVDRAIDNAPDVRVVRAVDEYARVTSGTGDDSADADPAASDSEAHGDEAHGDEAHEEIHDHGDQGDHAGHDHGADGNEHVWFSLPTVAAVAQSVAEELSAVDAGNADDYRDNARRFTESLAPLEDRIDQIHDRGHFSYVQTEPLAAHLFDAAHMVDRTPRGFLTAIEDDTDPSAADLAAILETVSGRQVDFLAFNTQTSTPVTTRVRDAAEAAGVPVVDLTETLPEGTDFLTWMTGVVDDLGAALDGATPARAGGR